MRNKMFILGGSSQYPRYTGSPFTHRSIQRLGVGYVVCDQTGQCWYFDSLPWWLSGGNYGGGIWSPWKANPGFTRWPSYQSSSGLGFWAGLTLGGLFGGRGGRRKQ